MKVVFLFSTLFFTHFLKAQPSYEVIETPKVLMESWQNSYTVNLEGISANLAMKAWSNQMQALGGVLLNNIDANALGFQQVQIPAISDQPLEVFVMTYEESESRSTHFTVWFRQGDQFISTRNTPDSFRPVSRLLLEFSFKMEDDLKKNLLIENQQKIDNAFPKTTVPPKNKG